MPAIQSTMRLGTRPQYQGPRDPTMADLFEVEDHPQRSGIQGRTFVYYQDTSIPGLKKTWGYEEKRQIPTGTLAELLASGWLHLKSGDAVFSRSTRANDDPEKDIIQLWVTDSRVITPDLGKDFDDARDDFLGARAHRTRQRPTGKPPTGGTAYERSTIRKSVKEPSRCYTIASSFEQPTVIYAPVASAKLGEAGNPDPAIRHRKRWHAPRIRSNLYEAAAAIAKAAFGQAPKKVQELVRLAHELVNYPLVGVEDNFAYATAQANISPSERADEYGHAIRALAKALGFFGGAHCDFYDQPGFFSHMSASSDLPDYDDEAPYEPGFFFIMQLGVFITLDKHTSINFSGLRRHGGTPPLCPHTGENLTNTVQHTKLNARRFVIIFYPPTRMIDGTARWSLAAMPNGEPFLFPPEAIHIGQVSLWYGMLLVLTNYSAENEQAKSWPAKFMSSRATFAREGPLMMSPKALFSFFIRALVLLCNFWLRQLPEEMKVEMEPDLFIQSITMWDPAAKKHVNAGQWEFAPGVRRPGRPAWETEVDETDTKDLNQSRSEGFKRFDAYEAEMASHIPSVGHEGPVKHIIPDPLPKSKPGKKAAGGAERGPATGKQSKRKAARKSRNKKSKAKTADEDMEYGKPERPVRKKKATWEIVLPPIGYRGETSPGAQQADGNMDDDGWETEPEDDDTPAIQGTFVCIDIVPSTDVVMAEAEISRTTEKRPIRAWTSDEYAAAAAKIVQTSSSSGALVLHSLIDEGSEDIAEMPTPTPSGSISQVETAMHIISSSTTGPQLTSQMIAAYAALTEKPGETATVALFTHLWPNLKQMVELAELGVIRLRLDRECIMLTNCCAWQWLDRYCPAQVQCALEKRKRGVVDASASWVERLGRDCISAVNSHIRDRVFTPATYGLSISAAPFQWTNPQSRRMYIDGVDDDEVLRRSTMLACQIISRWLGFPTGDVSRYQAGMIDVILSVLGRSALLLDEVWNAHKSLRKWVVGQPLTIKNCTAAFANLRASLVLHPLSNPASEEAKRLVHLAQLLSSFQAPALPVPAPRSPPPASVGTVPGNQAPVVPEAQSSSTASLSSSVLSLATLSAAERKHIPALREFVTDSVAVALNRVAPASQTTLQSFLLTGMDMFFPFRELAPSRRSIMRASGPFSPAHVATAEGFYSALIFRTITFNTDFVRNPANCVLFRSHDEFKAEMDRAGDVFEAIHLQPPPSSFFCNIGAYGTANFRRTVDLAERYAEQIFQNGEGLHTLILKARKGGRQSLRFSEARDYLTGRFYQLGPLTAYLLTADYAQTPLVDLPTYAELAEIIFELDSGAVHGLELLGLIPKRNLDDSGKQEPSTPEYCRRGLQIVHALLLDIVPTEDAQQVGVDLIVVEHLLCKVARAHQRKSGFTVGGSQTQTRKRRESTAAMSRPRLAVVYQGELAEGAIERSKKESSRTKETHTLHQIPRLMTQVWVNAIWPVASNSRRFQASMDIIGDVLGGVHTYWGDSGAYIELFRRAALLKFCLSASCALFRLAPDTRPLTTNTQHLSNPPNTPPLFAKCSDGNRARRRPHNPPHHRIWTPLREIAAARSMQTQISLSQACPESLDLPAHAPTLR
ncbi:hypothetical protein FB45DRAFT_864696 [Roridomyces roridus]|uniref:Uncharacterized protein n=1 Tax=Roridomyces roridus TaxID=1738132 RepID=A0AAD7FPW6_9AGAR|nr:hypothetical protein FB45DRAFT_864696 [Roridomyces roridus]